MAFIIMYVAVCYKYCVKSNLEALSAKDESMKISSPLKYNISHVLKNAIYTLHF
jgi:hypothetical protein